MQCASPCSTSSAGWSSSHSLLVVCEVLSQRESITFHASRLSPHLSSVRDEGGLEVPSFVSRQHCNGSPRILSCPVSRGRGKSSRIFAGLAAPVGVSVEYETDTVVAGADNFAQLGVEERVADGRIPGMDEMMV